MQKYLVLFTILLSFNLRAQTSTEVELKAEVKRYNWDTLKYRKYDYVLIVGLYQQHRDFTLTFQELINKDIKGFGTETFGAGSKLVTGLVINYDKFQLSFGIQSSAQDGSAGKGYTKMFNLGFNYGDNSWVTENYYRSFKGFYNKDTPTFDSTFKKTGQYYLQPGLTSTVFMTRLMYFTNHKKFSYQSGFGCNYHQLKSAATWILGASYNFYNLSNDSAIFPIQARQLFNDYGNLQGFRSYNFALNVGAAGTIVLYKAWFISGYFTVGPEQQWRSYNLGDHERYLSYVAFGGTGRIATGINLKKFYFLYSFTDDYNIYDSFNIMAFQSQSTTNTVTFGWRFHIGTPKFYRKFQQTKVYKFF